MTLYAGSNGGGKSLVTGQIAINLVKQGQKVCIASFEMKPKRTIYRMLRQFSGENIEIPQFDRASYILRLLERFAVYSLDKLWLYDQQGTTSSKQVIAMTRYCAVKLGIQHCPDCDVPIQPQSPDTILAPLMKDYRGQNITSVDQFMKVIQGLRYDQLIPNETGMNYEVGAKYTSTDNKIVGTWSLFSANRANRKEDDGVAQSNLNEPLNYSADPLLIAGVGRGQ